MAMFEKKLLADLDSGSVASNAFSGASSSSLYCLQHILNHSWQYKSKFLWTFFLQTAEHNSVVTGC